MKQLSFFEFSKEPMLKAHRVFGGSLSKGKRKVQRPITPKKWMHITLKATSAMGKLSMLNAQFRLKVDKIIRLTAQKNHITIGDGVNMGNHFHLKIKCQNRKGFQRFLRVITGKIARLVTGAKKGNSFYKKNGKRFWDELAFSRIVSTQFEELKLSGYFKANRIERSKGYRARIKYLSEFTLWVESLKRAPS